ncbi:DUF624 domain-containing protein [Desertihabitans brevis]|uniref:DUF624 domain-containing protein n=1 Tax=Desertihabitans brevis TaxID=2268447 RepID=A0A367YT78_9ACTN|nr:DUF624 domain-containing protein [Desertihabitans brevis]RCK69105.1 DUF624 domain-containing protein [Desertihabitans brevis]
MAMSTWSEAEVGPGMLARGSAVVYRLLVLQVLFVLAAAPGLVPAALLVPDPSNAPLLGLAALPLAPAASAVLYGWQRSTAEDDLAPARHFLRGYRLNALGVLGWWLPVVAVGTVLGINLGQLPAVAAGAALVGLQVATVLVLALVGVVAAHALVITSLYTVRGRDVLRLAAWQLARRRASTAVLALGVCAAGVLLVGSDWVLALLAAPVLALLLHLDRPVLTHIEETYVA